MLISRREGPNASAQPIYACGLRPEDFDIIIIKGVHAPVGAYAEICPMLIRVNTPGVTTADMETLNYENRRKPLFPFEEMYRVDQHRWQYITNPFPFRNCKTKIFTLPSLANALR